MSRLTVRATNGTNVPSYKSHVSYKSYSIHRRTCPFARDLRTAKHAPSQLLDSSSYLLTYTNHAFNSPRVSSGGSYSISGGGVFAKE